MTAKETVSHHGEPSENSFQLRETQRAAPTNQKETVSSSVGQSCRSSELSHHGEPSETASSSERHSGRLRTTKKRFQAPCVIQLDFKRQARGEFKGTRAKGANGKNLNPVASTKGSEPSPTTEPLFTARGSHIRKVHGDQIATDTLCPCCYSKRSKIDIELSGKRRDLTIVSEDDNLRCHQSHEQGND